MVFDKQETSLAVQFTQAPLCFISLKANTFVENFLLNQKSVKSLKMSHFAIFKLLRYLNFRAKTQHIELQSILTENKSQKEIFLAKIT